MSWLGCANASAQGYLDGAALRELLIGNTVTGTFPLEGRQAPFWEYYAENGTVYGMHDSTKYIGSYEIRDDGCLYIDFHGSRWDGCYYYEPESAGRHRYTRPYTDQPGSGKIIEGPPAILGI